MGTVKNWKAYQWNVHYSYLSSKILHAQIEKSTIYNPMPVDNMSSPS